MPSSRLPSARRATATTPPSPPCPPTTKHHRPNHAFDLALTPISSPTLSRHLCLHTVGNSNNEFVLVSDPNDLKSLGLLCFRHETRRPLSQCSTCLKRSLSKCLTKFYPLAGRIKDDVSVDCNDSGVDYLEAKVTNCTLLDVITNPNIPSLKQLLPCEPHIHDLESPLLLVQVNRFQCGGIAIGVCISHKVADASALGMFVNGWSCTARGDCETVAPHFELSTLFPWRDDTNDIEQESQATEGDYDHEKDNKIVTKRFVFNATDIARLRDKARNIESPTRIEVVSAFIWKRFVDSNRSKTRPTSKPYSVFHAMNLRNRRAPPLAEHGFGNMSVVVIESLETEDDDDEYCSLVGKIRSAIRGVDGEFVKKLESGDEWPVWVSPPLYFKNGVILMDTRDGEGIEAWVSLLNEDIVEFESDPDTLYEIYVDCNDAGVDYLEAKVTNCSLSDVLTNPNIESLVQLLPCKPYSPETKKESSESPLLLVQVNYFDCEGSLSECAFGTG
ncbi:hypothetical protein Scep_018075 [Stephania cephalantha]|uniref:Uncharacterized protein n=1 Tax=Stephania cephalantha TaxID=152367 RepID=A0AAP0IQR4_9MAGN